MNISQDRIKEILQKAETNKELFNWCEEYDEFVNESCHGCLSQEVEFILRQDSIDAPFSMGDLLDKQRESITDEDIRDRAKDKDLIITDWETFKDSDEYMEILDELMSECEVYEWHLISDPLVYEFEQAGNEIILTTACGSSLWGRQTTGQSIKLDYCVIQAFLSMLKRRLRA